MTPHELFRESFKLIKQRQYQLGFIAGERLGRFEAEKKLKEQVIEEKTSISGVWMMPSEIEQQSLIAMAKLIALRSHRFNKDHEQQERQN